MDPERWRLKVAPKAEREIDDLPAFVRRRVLASFVGLTTTPRGGDISKLAGTDTRYRLRVGNYRVLFTVHNDERTVEVTVVRHRASAYER